MNPQNNKLPANSQLPAVMSQDGESPKEGVTSGSISIQDTHRSESINSTNPKVQNLGTNINNTQASKSLHAPSIADDNDLIEKEWVNKAKLIIAKTKDDPREQSKELFKYKADYIKKRYNKDIKVSES